MGRAAKAEEAETKEKEVNRLTRGFDPLGLPREAECASSSTPWSVRFHPERASEANPQRGVRGQERAEKGRPGDGTTRGGPGSVGESKHSGVHPNNKEEVGKDMTKLQNWAAKKVIALQTREEGQGLAEYGMILALIAVVAIGAVTILGGNITSTFTSMSGAF